MMVSSASGHSSLMAKYTICRSAGCNRKRLYSISTELLLKEDAVTHVSVLEELRSAKEEGGSLLSVECLSIVEEIDDFCEQNPTLSRADGCLIKHSSFLDDRCLQGKAWSEPLSSLTCITCKLPTLSW